MAELREREVPHKEENGIDKSKLALEDDPGEKVGLKRQVSLVSGIALIVGTMIGSGIFVSPKGVLRQTESVGMSLIIWLLCGIISMFGALCYAELGTMIPKSGGEYTYLRYTFHDVWAFLFGWVSMLILKPSSVAIISLSFASYVAQPFFSDECPPPALCIKLMGSVCISALCYAELGTIITKSGGEYVYLYETLGPIPAYLFSWTSIMVLKPSSVAAIALSFGAYIADPFFPDDCEPPTLAVKLFAALCILMIVFVNCASVKWATSVQNFFTAAKLLALVIIILVGFVKICQGNTQYLKLSVSFDGSATDLFAYGVAFYQGLWAYDGWNQLNYITEELIKPHTNLPRAIMIGIPLVTILYLLVNISYFTVMSPDELLASGAVAVTFADRTLGPMAWIIPFFVCCSTFGATNGSLFTSGRLAYVAAREGHMVEVISMVHVKRYTPFPALVFTSLVAIIMLIPGDFESLVNYFSFSAWLFYGGTVSALLVLRYREPDIYRPIKVPLFIPIVILICSVYLIIAPIIDEPAMAYLYAFLFIIAGLIFYFPFVHFRYHPKFMGKVTHFFQLLFEVAPSAYEVPEIGEDGKM